jgi:hypothetical protein
LPSGHLTLNRWSKPLTSGLVLLQPQTSRAFAFADAVVQLTETCPPASLTFFAGSGFGAGPDSGEPSVIEKWLPWQGHTIWPPDISLTVHPIWVQMALNALNCPLVGWVTTTCWPARIVPPPTGTSASGTVAEAPEPPPLEPPFVGFPAEWLRGLLDPLEPPEPEPLPPHAASSGSASPPTATPRSMVRREQPSPSFVGSGAGGSEVFVMRLLGAGLSCTNG